MRSANLSLRGEPGKNCVRALKSQHDFGGLPCGELRANRRAASPLLPEAEGDFSMAGTCSLPSSVVWERSS